MLDDGNQLIIRSTLGAVRVEPEQRELVLRCLDLLDGTRNLHAVLDGERARDSLYVLSLLQGLGALGVLADGPATIQSAGFDPDIDPKRQQAEYASLGIVAAVNGQGSLSYAIERFLAAAGVKVVDHAESTTESVSILCSDGPDIELFERWNRLAHDGKTGRWIPVFPFGDELVVGPVISPGVTPCFRCLILRWLGISPTIELERIFLHVARQAAGRVDERTLEPATADLLAGHIGPVLITRLVEARHVDLISMLRLESMQWTDSVLSAHPTCEWCGPRYRSGSTAADQKSWHEPAQSPTLAEVRASLSPLVEGRFALAAPVARPATIDPDGSRDQPHIAVSRFALPEPEEVVGDQFNWTHGLSFDPEGADTLSRIEAVERYCGLLPTWPSVRASFEEVADSALLPTDLPLFSPAQYRAEGFPFRPFTTDEELSWVWGHEVIEDRPILVPSAAVRYGEDELLSETSSGIAAHSSRGSALHHALLEVIERDAFMLFWLHRLTPPLVDISAVADRSVRLMYDDVEQRGYTVAIADLRTDLRVPTFLALGFRDDGLAPALLVGAGASLDPTTALQRSLSELYAAARATSTRLWTPTAALAAADVVELEDHGRAYEHPDWLQHAAFLWSGRKTHFAGGWIPEASSNLQTLLALLTHHRLGAIAVDITAPEISSSDLVVVRGLIPGMQPLGFGNRIRLGGKRLFEAPNRMGYSTSTAEADLNTVPHCFP